MPRLPLPSDSDLTPAGLALLATRAPIALYRAIAWSPALQAPLMQLVTAFFERTTLSDRVREIAILRVAMHHASAYEAHHHRGLALRAGLTQSEVDQLLSPGAWTSPDAAGSAVAQFVDEVISRNEPSLACFARVRADLGCQGLTELALLTGFYRMVATFTAAVGLEPDERTAVQLREEIRN